LFIVYNLYVRGVKFMMCAINMYILTKLDLYVITITI